MVSVKTIVEENWEGKILNRKTSEKNWVTKKIVRGGKIGLKNCNSENE